MSDPTRLQKTIGKRAPDGAWEVPILGDIGFFGVDGADLIRELMAVKPTQVRFLIYSPGGAVYDAIAVCGYMLEQKIESFTEIYGLCASAATIFAAHSGPKNTAIAPGSMFLVHMPYGGDQKAIDNAVAFCVDLYSKSYGWTKAEARKHMEADGGEGVLWTAAEAKQFGVASEIMEGARVAARARMSINEQPTAMAEKKTVSVHVKLSTMEAVRAALGEGTTVEVEAEQATAEALAAKDTRIAELEAELEAAKAKTVDEAAHAEALNNATQEAVTAKADLATAVAAKATEIEALKTAHAAEIAELKKPVAEKVVADNQTTAVGAMPGKKAEPTQGESIISEALKNANPLMKAQVEMQREKVKA